MTHMDTLLAGPLAAALDAATVEQTTGTSSPGWINPAIPYEPVPQYYLTADRIPRILAALRADPSVLQAMAEALRSDVIGLLDTANLHMAGGKTDAHWEFRAAAILNALLGPSVTP